MMFLQDNSAVEAVELGGSVPDFSMWGMFAQADMIVKSVMILLILASFWSWSIIFEKLKRIKEINADANDFEDAFWSGTSLEDLYNRAKVGADHPMTMVFVAAMREWKKSLGDAGSIRDRLSLQDRLDRVMRVTINREVELLERHTPFLATVGSTAPFVGLFGTVWGIMNSFQSIAVTSNTSLAVVAPGIAEALFATAIGLVAAIPAVIAYNRISHEMDRYITRLEGFADEFSAIVSRELDERGH